MDALDAFNKWWDGYKTPRISRDRFTAMDAFQAGVTFGSTDTIISATALMEYKRKQDEKG